jgi:hypothetical protein
MSKTGTKKVHQFLYPFYGGTNGNDRFGINSDRSSTKKMPVHPVACLLKSKYYEIKLWQLGNELPNNEINKQELKNRLSKKIGKVARKVSKGKRKTTRPAAVVEETSTDKEILEKLGVIIHGAILQFYYLSMIQHEPEVRSASVKLLLEKFRKRFDRILVELSNSLLLIHGCSIVIHSYLDKASEKTKQFIQDEFLTCNLCYSLYHKSVEELIPLHHTPLISRTEDELVGSTYLCINCSTKRFGDTNRTVSRGRTLDDPLLGNVDSENGQKKGGEKPKECRNKKKEQQESESISSQSTDDSMIAKDKDTHLQQDEEKLHQGDRSSSPTAVNLTNDDWVDFLMTSGSIIALNEYMDRVLGVDDSKVPDNYDSNEQML